MCIALHTLKDECFLFYLFGFFFGKGLHNIMHTGVSVLSQVKWVNAAIITSAGNEIIATGVHIYRERTLRQSRGQFLPYHQLISRFIDCRSFVLIWLLSIFVASGAVQSAACESCKTVCSLLPPPQKLALPCYQGTFSLRRCPNLINRS